MNETLHFISTGSIFRLIFLHILILIANTQDTNTCWSGCGEKGTLPTYLQNIENLCFLLLGAKGQCVWNHFFLI